MSPTALLGGTVLTMDAGGTILPGGVVVVDDGAITHLGLASEFSAAAGTEMVDCTGTLVLPGFVNAHTHVSQTLLRGGPNHSRTLYDWLLNVVIPGLEAYEPGDLGLAVRLYCAEATRAGLTTLIANEEPVGVDADALVREVLDAFVESGMRVRYAYMYRDQAPGAIGSERGVETVETIPTDSELDAIFRRINAFGAEYREHSGGRVDVWASPATTAVVSAEGLRRAFEHSRRINARWTTHLAEIPLEGNLRDVSPVRYLEQLSLLDHRLLAGHCVHVDDEDIDLLAQSRVGVATNPVSNCFLGSGIAPVFAMKQRDVLVGLGTDDANCNDSINPLSDLKTLALLHRGLRADPEGLQPDTLVRMATSDAARAAGLDGVGSLEVGKQADLQVIALNEPQLAPMHDPYSALVFQAYGNEVRDVMVAGRWTMRGRQLDAEPDLDGLCREAQSAATRILDRAGIAGTRRKGV